MALQPRSHHNPSSANRTRPKSHTVTEARFSRGTGALSSRKQPPLTNFLVSNDSYTSYMSPTSTNTPSSQASPMHRRVQSHGLLSRTSSLPYIEAEDDPYTSPRIQPMIPVQYQPTVTTVYYGKKDGLKITPLSSRRGTVLLSTPLKRKKLTDARDRTLATLRSKNQELHDQIEAIQAANRALEADKERLLNQKQKNEDDLKISQSYNKSLHRILFRKTAKENIYWLKGEPVFAVDEVDAKGHDLITAMDINLEIKQYETKKLSKRIKIDSKRTNNAALFETYLEKIIRSSRIFQNQYYAIKQQKQQSASTETEALKFKVKLENAEKDFKNKQKVTQQKHDQEVKKQQDKMNEYKVKLQSITKEKQELITTVGNEQSNAQELIKEKEILERDYGRVANRLNNIEKHPILSNVKKVEELLHFENIQRAFYEEIFDEKANIHNMAFEYVRKEIKRKTGFNGKYCKQMALKVLFEIIHMIWSKMKERFVGICESIRGHLGVTFEEKHDETDLEKALDFVLKYQYEEIWNNVTHIMVNDIMEEIYRHQFELIQMHDAQHILSYDLHQTTDPFTRDKRLYAYIDKICMLCWKMVIYSHKNANDNQLVFYPISFIENNKDLEFNNNVYDKCTAHCEKKCDKILFYVFPIIIRIKDRNNIKASKIPIKVVTRDKLSKSLSKDVKPQSGAGEPIDAVGVIKLLTEPWSIAMIGEAFKTVHKQYHNTLLELMTEFLEDDETMDIEDDMLEMKIYKILFDILVSCYVEIVNRVNEIKNDTQDLTTLKFDKRYHLLLNFEHYFSKFSKLKDIKDRERLQDKEIVIGLIDDIYNKYCALYGFLQDKELQGKTKIFIMKCCECCFHFVSYSINADFMRTQKDEYGLYPLCFVKDGAGCLVIGEIEEKSMNNEVIDFHTVLMGSDTGLCVYDDKMHEKESTSGDVKDIRNARICYFTWPAIVTTNRNNEYIYGNIPKKYLTKIWIQIGDELYDQIYVDNQ